MVHSPSQTTRELNINIYFDVICIHTAQREPCRLHYCSCKKRKKRTGLASSFVRHCAYFPKRRTSKIPPQKRRERKKKKDSRTQKVSLFSAAPAPPSYQVQRGTRKRLYSNKGKSALNYFFFPYVVVVWRLDRSIVGC